MELQGMGWGSAQAEGDCVLEGGSVFKADLPITVKACPFQTVPLVVAFG